MSSTYALQQGRTAAVARPCSGVVGGTAFLSFGASSASSAWNAPVAMGMALDTTTCEWTHVTTKRRPTRHLGVVPS